jgi:hypothetical protein
MPSIRPKNKVKYESVQISSEIKQQIKVYVEQRGLKIGKFVEIMFHAYMSGSTH